ncbi:hypothetical protein ATY36_18005 [Vibrio cidicii]|uniref:glycosyltransferase family 4 protein n=1 Tax=Vibrio cidicii TaxID=1763883 RepID=UPI000780089D|nr:glycosyltransferase family 4 protein [Vibrio cidicii]KYN80526.1 hypothetical protein ATY36_18005 [Vibrio cidicii]
MKVLFVAPRYHTNQCGIVKTLIDFGCEVRFDVLKRGESENYRIISPNIIEVSFFSKVVNKFFPSNKSNLYYAFPSFIKYYLNLKASKIDVIIIRDPKRYFSVIAALAAKSLNIKIVFYTQDTTKSESTSWFKSWQQKLIKSIFDAEWITPIGGVDTEVKKYLPFVVSSNKKEMIERDNISDSVRILSIGKYVKRKRLDLLLQMLITFPLAELTIIGEESSEEHTRIKKELELLSDSLGVSERVEFISNMSHADVLNIYSEFDVFILPAEKEPASISVLEAMASGVPVICADTCGTSSYIKPGVTGYIFTENNLDDLLIKYRELENLIKQKGKKDIQISCFRHADLEFSESAYISRAKNIFLK